MSEVEISYISAEYWSRVHRRLDPGFSTEPERWTELLAFQNGWEACKAFYKINE